jgi:hypothetical protein
MSDALRAYPDPERKRLIRSVFERSRIDEVAEAISVASGEQKLLYVERVADGYRWGLVHAGGLYPVLRITARFLRMSHDCLIVGRRALEDTGLSLLCKDIHNPEPPLEWALLELEAPLTADEAAELIRRGVGG